MAPMPGESVEIPKQVLASIETLDELYDWLTAQNAGIMAELREARQEDIEGKFTAGSHDTSHGLPSRSRLAGECTIS